MRCCQAVTMVRATIQFQVAKRKAIFLSVSGRGEPVASGPEVR